MATGASRLAQFGGVGGEEISLDEATVRDTIQMFRTEPAVVSARESYLANTLSAPFTFSIPKMGVKSKHDMNRLIERHWMPWLRRVYDWTRIFGVCPYYFVRKGSQHQIPIVPEMEMGHIRVYVNHKTHSVEYRWYWSHGKQQHHEKKMLWVITDRAPTATGQLRSVLTSLLTRYRTILVLRRSLEKAATQNANLSHLLEYHPPKASAQNDDLTQMVANFGEKAAGLSKARQEAAKAKDIQVRTNELLSQVRQVHNQNTWGHGGMRVEHEKLSWTDTPQNIIDRMDNGLDRMVPLRPDFKYVSPARATVIAELERYQNSFDIDAAAAMGYAYELIRPTGSARTQNVEGAKRFVNERAKQGIGFFVATAHSALIVAYGKQFEEGFADFNAWQINRRGGNQDVVAELHPEIDVEVYMTCTPTITYEELRNMWMDEILDKNDFAHHAFEINALPVEQISLRRNPDMAPQPVQQKQQQQQRPKNDRDSKKRAQLQSEDEDEQKDEKKKKKKKDSQDNEDKE